MSELVRNALALVVAVVVVHLIYLGLIRPEAAEIMEQAQAAGVTTPRHWAVIFKDYEQEVCCVLMLWGVYLIAGKCREILKHQYLLGVDLTEGAMNSEKGGLDSAKALALLDNELAPEHQRAPLVRVVRAGLWRFETTGDVQNLSDAVESHIEALAVRHEAENSMIRYLIWAIPSIGFIGTVRGIGQALAQADEALAGDIVGMTDSLGVAFNSTFVALLMSIGLMFLFHQLQRLQDGQLVDIQAYCDRTLLARAR